MPIFTLFQALYLIGNLTAKMWYQAIYNAHECGIRLYVFMIYTPHQILCTWGIKSRTMRWAWHVAHKQEKRGEEHTGFWCANLREADHLEDLGINGRITLKWNIGIGWDSMDWTDLAANGDKWRAVVNTVLNHQVP
jgi:hypothetical protein